MSFKATLDIDGKTFDILDCSYSFHQDVDESTGRVTSGVKGGIVSFYVISTDDDTFISWMLDPHALKDGKITFYKSNQDSKMREINFTQAACVHFSETFGKEELTTIGIKMLAQTMDIDGNKNPQ